MRTRRVFLSLGSNLGSRQENLEGAIARMEAERIRVVRRSSIYETEPQDVTGQPWFLNMVVECETDYFPIQLLRVLLRVERESGRLRGAGNVRRGPRVIDIDVLLYGDVVMDTPQLTIPHPRMALRRFVLEPLLELAPDLRLPQTKEALSSRLQQVKDQRVRKL